MSLFCKLTFSTDLGARWPHNTGHQWSQPGRLGRSTPRHLHVRTRVLNSDTKEGRSALSSRDDTSVHKQGHHEVNGSHRVPTTVAIKETPAESAGDDKSSGGLGQAKLLAPALFVAGLVLVGVASTVYKQQISDALDYFILVVEQWGPLGYAAFGAVYALLEVLAVPAIPLTMAAGIVCGVAPGVAVVSISGTIAATISFLIARYAARDKIQEIANKNPKFAAIDKAIGKNSLKVVTLLRLSPLLPLSVSNYLYGLTSVDLPSYILGSWLGMLPGTIAYVLAGSYGKTLLTGEDGVGGIKGWQIGLGIGVTAVALLYIGKLAKEALADVESGEQS